MARTSLSHEVTDGAPVSSAPVGGAVVLTIVLGIVTNRLSDKDALAFFHAHGVFIVLALLGLGALTLWAGHVARQLARREQIHQAFALFKPSSDLRPEDLEFQLLTPGKTIGPHTGFDKRPFYATYISRRAIAHDHLATQDDRDIFNEKRLTDALSQGRGFV